MASNFFQSFRQASQTAAANSTKKLSKTVSKSSFRLSGPSFRSTLASLYQIKAKTPTLSTSYSSQITAKPNQSTLSQVSTITARLPQLELLDRSDVKLNVPCIRQGHNQCGPTSLEMIAKYYGINNLTRNMFSSDTVGHGPNNLRLKAIGKGMRVRYENNGSVSDLVKHIDNGCPVTILGINGGCSNLNINNYFDYATKGHYVNVVGYKKNDYGQVTDVYVNDPNYSTTQTWSVSKLNSFWKNNSIPTSHRFYMVFTKKGTYQDTLLKKTMPTNNVTNDFDNMLKTVDALEDSFYAAEAAGKSFADAVQKAGEDVLDWAEDVGDTIADAASDAWDEVSSWFS